MLTVLDAVDRQIVHAMQVDGRAPFSRWRRSLGVSEQTVARRWRRLRADGVVRVLGCHPRGAPSPAGTSGCGSSRRRPARSPRRWPGGRRLLGEPDRRGGRDHLPTRPRTPPPARRPAAGPAAAHGAGHRPGGVLGAARLRRRRVRVDRLRGPADRGAARRARHDPRERGPPRWPSTRRTSCCSRRWPRRPAQLRRAGRGDRLVGEPGGATGGGAASAGALYFDLEIASELLGHPVERAALAAAWPRPTSSVVGESLAREPETAFTAVVTGPANLMVAVDLPGTLRTRTGSSPTGSVRCRCAPWRPRRCSAG